MSKHVESSVSPSSLEYGRAVYEAERRHRGKVPAIEGSLHSKAIHLVYINHLARVDMIERHCVQTMMIDDEYIRAIITDYGWDLPRDAKMAQTTAATLDALARIIEGTLGNDVEVTIKLKD